MDKNKVIESAAKLVAKGAFDKAVKEYQRILEEDPDDVRVLQKLAELYQKMQRKDDAADCFEKVAKTYAAQGFYLKAVALYKQVLKVVERIQVNVRLAELYQQLGLVGDATKEWQSVAAHYEKAGDHKASLDTLKKLVDLDPDNVAARIRLGEQYARQEQTAEAVAELRRAATHLQRAGRQDDYLRVAERISHLDQGDAVLARELAESYLAKGDSKRALAKLQVCFKANPRDLGTLQMLARAFQDLGQISKTVSVLKEQARVHADGQRPDEAKRIYQQALQLAPDDSELKSLLASAAAPTAPAPAPRAAAPAQAVVPPPPPAAARPPPARPAPAAAPPPRPAPSAAAAAPPRPDPTPVTSGAVPKLLKETEVYVKYGLNDKALEHLRKIFSVEPDNAEAHEKAKALALSMEQPAEAAASLAVLVRVYTANRDPRASAARAELQALDPENPALSGKAAAAPRGRPPEPEGEILDLLDEPAPAPRAKAPSAPPAAARRPPAAPAPARREDPVFELADEAQDEAVVADPALQFSEGSGGDFASDLAEADFYIQAGLHDDARAILESILLSAPEHPEALERLASLPGAGGAAPAAPRAGAATSASDDLAAELAAELAEEVESLGPQDDEGPLEPESLESFQVPLQDVLGEFRAKVSETIRPEDVQTHYDLGIAYKEMGLVDEAVGEFDLALRHSDGMRKADCLTMLGTCALEKGNLEDAIEWFKSGLSEPGLTDEARRALAFELAAAYEAAGKPGLALEQYQEVERAEPGFRDVADRIRRLGGDVSGPKRPGAARPPAARPPAAPAAAAARAPSPGGAGNQPAVPEPPSRADSAAADAQRRNRKIGFV